MSKSSAAFLQMMENRSKEQEQAFIQNIADRLGRKREMNTLDHPFRGAPKFWNEYELDQDQAINMFIGNWKIANGYAERFGTMDEAKAFIIKISEDLKAKHWIRFDQLALEKLRLEEELPNAEMTVWDPQKKEVMKSKAAGADIGLITADYAVAHTGSIVTKSSAEKGRIVSLLPTALIAIVPADRVKTRLGEVMQEIGHIGKENMPAGIHFISGPSRSADIENDLTIGVHGPGIVFALVVG